MIPTWLGRIVLDTNVWIAALRSQLGASFRLLSLVGTEKFEIKYNGKHFRGAEQFSIEAITPPVFLQKIGELS